MVYAPSRLLRQLRLVSSFFFFTYGAGQLFHGILSKKYNTRYSVAVALIGSAAVNVAMSFCSDAVTMKYIWLFNGFFQSILWSSVVKTLSERLPDEMLPKAIVVMSTPPALGTFVVYGISALLSSKGVSYKTVFLIPAVLLLVIGAAWFALTGRADKLVTESELIPKERKKQKLSPAFLTVAALVLIIAISNGFIKDGVTTWTPSILKEHYGMKESLSILLTVILPLIAIAGSWLSTGLHKRWKNTSGINALLYLTETAVLFGVILVTRYGSADNPVFLILLFSVSAMLMSAVNNIITSIIPLYMRDRMESGLLAGVLDTFCYIGSSLSTGLLGYISDKSSWNGVFLCLFAFGAAAFAFCVISATVGRKKQIIV
ncbi:MAG: MFS transporter [Bacteroidales bacterium]|nr:MFS transporter [Bacteroidales bacterium]